MLIPIGYACSTDAADRLGVYPSLELIQSHSILRTIAEKKVGVTFNTYTSDNNDLDVTKVGELLIKLNGSQCQQAIVYSIDASWGDSSSMSLALGKHLFYRDQIIIFRYWAWRGDALISPFGAKKTRYQWHNETESYHQLSNEVYIEYQGWHGTPSTQGLRFKRGVIREPRSAEERRLVDDYIAQVTAEGERFLLGRQAERLLNETRAVFKKEIKERTDYWPKADNAFGYRR